MMIDKETALCGGAFVAIGATVSYFFSVVGIYLIAVGVYVWAWPLIDGYCCNDWSHDNIRTRIKTMEELQLAYQNRKK